MLGPGDGMSASSRPLQVVVVAGGLGSRLAQLRLGRPKVLAPVNGRPFLSYVLALLAEQDVRSVHLCLGHQAEQVLRWLEERPPDHLRITASVEQRPLGTAGCLVAAESALDDEFVLMLGDSYMPVCLSDLVMRWRQAGTEAGMVVLHNRDWLVPSNVHVCDGLVSSYSKKAQPGTMEHVDYGIALLLRDSLRRLAMQGPADLAALYEPLIKESQLAAIEVRQRFYEIGSRESYAEFIQLAANGCIPRYKKR